MQIRYKLALLTEGPTWESFPFLQEKLAKVL